MRHLGSTGIVLFVVAALASLGPRVAMASPCKMDGEDCRTSRSCCGMRGNDGVCVKDSGKFGLCCTRVGNDTNCDGRDDDCDGVADDGYLPTSTTCGTGECMSVGSLACTNGGLWDTCDPSTTDGNSCSDGSVCTVGDACSGGDCIGSHVDGCCETDQDCVYPHTCGGDGTANVCGCTPSTCTEADCGAIPDGCGGTLDCPCSRCRGYCTDGLTSISTVCGRDQDQLCLPTEAGCFDVCETECQEHAGVGCDSAACQPCDP